MGPQVCNIARLQKDSMQAEVQVGKMSIPLCVTHLENFGPEFAGAAVHHSCMKYVYSKRLRAGSSLHHHGGLFGIARWHEVCKTRAFQRSTLAIP